MMGGRVSDQVDSITLAIAQAMYRGSILVASEASENFAPKGHTLQLSRGIRAIKPVIDSTGNVVGQVISSARSKDGYDYAAKQHNVKLRHYSEQPLRQGFVDVGTGRTRRARYRDGYIKLKDSSPKYATEYLNKGLDARRDQLLRMIANAVRDA